MLLKEEVFQIVGAAIEVSNTLGCGFLEAVYQEALLIELSQRGIPFSEQCMLPISYKGQILAKKYTVDFLCFNQIVVEIKAIRELGHIEEAQCLNYLHAGNHPVGVLINFGRPKLEWKRLIQTI